MGPQKFKNRRSVKLSVCGPSLFNDYIQDLAVCFIGLKFCPGLLPDSRTSASSRKNASDTLTSADLSLGSLRGIYLLFAKIPVYL